MKCNIGSSDMVHNEQGARNSEQLHSRLSNNIVPRHFTEDDYSLSREARSKNAQIDVERIRSKCRESPLEINSKCYKHNYKSYIYNRYFT
eukprot:296923-Amphidinium_carterae.8